ncbi:MAG: FAD-binding oxidoreductase [Deltaproteobacteria bacterium]|nr:MAG: FAD-binding oxidoreductase [Deltaproteobacteria bacterium]
MHETSPTRPSRGSPSENRSGGAPSEHCLVPLSGWGRSTVVWARERSGEDLEQVTRDVVLCRGLGRSYGDAALPAREGEAIASTIRANRLLAFDPDAGVLRAEAGFSIHELVRFFLPRGWFAPVSPGTQFVTLGGAIAADVHGKAHHQQGCFGRHLRKLRMRVGDGSIVECSRDQHPELFRATQGGMGLTGHILDAEFQLERLPSPWIEQEVEICPDLHTLMGRLREAGDEWPFTVSWVDGFARGRNFGRGVVVKGRWARAEDAPPTPPPERFRPAVPFEMPSGLLNESTGRLFYEFYYRMQRRGRRVVHPAPFFYPLDSIRHWNRLYGSRGFTQYQCVLPEGDDIAGAQQIFEQLQREHAIPFLAVVKDFGAEGEGMLSFPRSGLTLALDIPIDRDRTQVIVDQLNERVIAHGGRIYLAKDAFTREVHFRAMEPRLADWTRVREKWDPEHRIRSALAVRLLGDEA